MIAVGGLLVAGGTVYAARKVIKSTKMRFTLPWLKAQRDQIVVEERTTKTTEIEQSLGAANRAIAISSTSLGLAVAGVLVHPMLIVASVPVTLFIFIPTFQSAYHSLREERRITTSVLDATRVTVCVVMGYYWVGALNAWFQTLSQKLLAQGELDFKRTLQRYAGEADESVWLFTDGVDVQTARHDLLMGDVIAVEDNTLFVADGRVIYGSAMVDEQILTGRSELVHKAVGDPVYAATRLVSGSLYIQVATTHTALATDAVRTTLQRTIENGAYTQQLGEQSGATAAPGMLGIFALLLPFWDVNRAAGFLTTSFGAQMRTLSPFTLQTFVALAAEQGILLKDGHALERLNLVNTVMIDAATLTDEQAIAQAKTVIQMLRKRFWPVQTIAKHPLAIYLMGTKEEEVRALAAQLGCDDYFVEPDSSGRIDLLERLQISGRLVCYVGDGITHASVMAKAFVGISLAGAATVAEDAAPIVFASKALFPLPNLFDLATQFIAKQGFNLAWPLLMDLVDIGTTVFFHMGLIYSVCFSYSGLLLSTLNARTPLWRYRRSQAAQAESNSQAQTSARDGEIVLFAQAHTSPR